MESHEHDSSAGEPLIERQKGRALLDLSDDIARINSAVMDLQGRFEQSEQQMRAETARLDHHEKRIAALEDARRGRTSGPREGRSP